MLLWVLQAEAQIIPAKGSDNTLELGNWNLNWFGKTASGFGPSDDSAQFANVDSIITNANIDLWVFSEVCDTNLFNRLLSRHQHLGHAYSRYSGEQKNAIVFDKRLFKLGMVTMLDSGEKENFSAGRYPLYVRLISLTALMPDTLHIIALHLKANVGDDTKKMSAYNSRKKSSEWLADYLSSQLSGKRVIVAGDWNDDLDLSIYNELPSPLTACKSLSPDFIFLTQLLTDNDISTTLGYDNPIDHLLASQLVAQNHIQTSLEVWRLDQIVSEYEQICSDHLPVICKFSNSPSSYDFVQENVYQIYPNPSVGLIHHDFPHEFEMKLMDSEGREFEITPGPSSNEINLTGFEPGIYTLIISNEQTSSRFKIVIQR